MRAIRTEQDGGGWYVGGWGVILFALLVEAAALVGLYELVKP
jgi:hypothetical protein